MQHKFATLAGKLKVASVATQRKSWCGATSKTALTTPSETIINHSAPTDLSRTVPDQTRTRTGTTFERVRLQSVASCKLIAMPLVPSLAVGAHPVQLYYTVQTYPSAAGTELAVWAKVPT